MKRTRENGAPTEALPSTVKTMNATQRVDALRVLMREHKVDAFIVPSEDAHMSEYVAFCDERRAFLTSFTGSAGTGLVTLTGAYCWTDGRYFVQAEKELDPTVFTMMRTHEDPSVDQWLVNNMADGAVVAVDGRTISASGMKRLRATVAVAAAASTKKNLSIVCLPTDVPNLIDQVWASARPAPPASRIFVHPEKYAGHSVADKLAQIREKMQAKDAKALMVTGLDEVAWLLNLRGSDVEYNPVFWAYLLVTSSDVTMYVNETRFGEGVAQQLEENAIRLRPYDSLYEDMREYLWDADDKVWVDPGVCNYSILESIEAGNPGFIKRQGPIPLAKARKNDVELKGMRDCHLRDAVAVCKFLCWLERQMENGADVDEVSAADKLDGLRSEQDLFVSLSFPTISSAGANGAIIHYRPEKKTCAKLTTSDMYVVDSGGQYRDGTTDVTRTVHLGEPTEWQRECFTRVLRGHIAIDMAVFPKGTTGHLLDGFARRALWEIGLDYKHGTGHGVGSFLNVHEGPHVVSFKTQALETGLDAGFLTSNEPGYYEENEFGIRIENVCIILERTVKGPPGGAQKMFLGMEHVTLVPLQKKLIDVELMTTAEKQWVDTYHEEILEKVSARLGDDEETLAWLTKNTQKLAAA